MPVDNDANAEWDALLSRHRIKPTVMPVDSNDEADRDALLARDGMKSAMTRDARVARALLVWSLSLFAAVPVIGLVGIFWVLIVLTPRGDDIPVETAYIPSQIAMNVLGSAVVAMLIASFILGVLSYAGPWRRRGQQDQ